MTNHRPDIFCTGCGSYCYSLSHLPHEQVFPDTFYCKECKDGIKRHVRTSAMIDHAWYRKFHEVLNLLEKKRSLHEDERTKIGSFGWTMRTSHTKQERAFDTDPDLMTTQEWKEITTERLEYFKRYCSQKQHELLVELIAVADAPIPVKRAMRQRKAA